MQSPAGTGKVAGRVVAAETGGPVRRAQVRLSAIDARFTRSAISDSNGHYEIQAVPPGRYRVYVSRAGYISLEYGQARPYEAGKLLDIAQGQTLDRLDFNLPRGSAVSGRITDEFGDPVTDAQVQAMRFQFTNGERTIVPAGRTARTDDLGRFRVFGLMPGEYLVQATMRPDNSPGVSGAAEDHFGYTETYYPGVVDVAQAQTVSLAVGEEINSITFQLSSVRLSTIAGTIMSSAGRPLPNAMIRLHPVGIGSAIRRNVRPAARPDGTFRLTNVPPGEYALEVHYRPGPMRGDPQNTNAAQAEFASMRIHVGGDMDNLVVVTNPGITLSGRIVFAGANAHTASPRGMQLRAVGSSGASMGTGQVNVDRTFGLQGVAGRQLILVSGVPNGWTLKSIVVNGIDITDAGFDFEAGASVNDAVVTLTDRVSQLTGSVRTARGEPEADYVLVVFPEDARLWASHSRYVAVARPDQNGTFDVKGLPAARYMAAAVPAVDPTIDQATWFAQLRSKAQSFVLADGQQLIINFEMAAR